MISTDDTATTKVTVRGILKLYPELTYGGFVIGGGPKRSRKERAAEKRRARRKMLTLFPLDQFRRAISWLDEQPRTRKINRRAGSSYGLKEEVELDGQYVSSGMFIAAAIACGYQVERAGFNSRDAWLNIGQLRQTNPNLEALRTHPEAVRLIDLRNKQNQPPASGR